MEHIIEFLKTLLSRKLLLTVSGVLTVLLGSGLFAPEQGAYKAMAMIVLIIGYVIGNGIQKAGETKANAIIEAAKAAVNGQKVNP
jgi:hypothetical protein